jgi:transcriptional regulator with XRE-family HTH domain
MSDLGKRVQELRKQKGLTQAQLAEKINISHT